MFCQLGKDIPCHNNGSKILAKNWFEKSFFYKFDSLLGGYERQRPTRKNAGYKIGP